MTENRTGQDEGDFGETELDPRERAEADLNLEDPTSSADEPWTPPERMPRGSEFIGVETDGGESLDQRLNQEVAEEGTAYGAHDHDADREGAEMLGGDDPDAIPADQDVLGGPAGGDDDAVTGPGPESSAMRVVEEDAED
jgi:hypothetical protein